MLVGVAVAAAGGGEGSYLGGDFFLADLGRDCGTESLIRLSLNR